MAHVHTTPGDYDHTASAFIIRAVDGETKVMLHLHRKIGKWMMIGGHIEINESPWDCILREIVEESGYELSQLEILQPSYRIQKLADAVVHPVPVVHSTKAYPNTPLHYHTDLSYAFVADGEPEGTPLEGESTGIIWVSQKELNAIPEDEIVLEWKEVANAVLSHHSHAWNRVPLSNFGSYEN